MKRHPTVPIPLVTIVLTTLNAARYIRECLDSCVAQTHPNFELILVDGGSTDETLSIVNKFEDPRIRILDQPDNVGKVAGAINIGLDAAQGEFVTWMQADSVFASTAIEEMVDALERNSDAGQVCSDYWVIDADGRIVKVVELSEPESFLDALGDPGGVCFLLRRRVRDAVGRHDCWAFPSHDYDYRMRIALQFKTIRITRPLYYWRVHPSSLSTRLTWVTLARKDVAIRQKLGLSNEVQACRLLAKIDIAFAFECFQGSRYREVPSLVLSALRRDPRYVRNRGVWAIFVKSLGRNR